MKAIEIKVVTGGGRTWTQTFSDFPTMETIRLRLKGNYSWRRSDLFELARGFTDGGWRFLENPDRWVQEVRQSGVFMCRIEMTEKNVYVCGDQQILQPNKE